jgi:hypothetical protein
VEAFDWIVAVAGVLGIAGYGWLVASGRIPLRDTQGRVRPIVWLGALGAALVVAGLLMNVRD